MQSFLSFNLQVTTTLAFAFPVRLCLVQMEEPSHHLQDKLIFASPTTMKTNTARNKKWIPSLSPAFCFDVWFPSRKWSFFHCGQEFHHFSTRRELVASFILALACFYDTWSCLVLSIKICTKKLSHCSLMLFHDFKLFLVLLAFDLILDAAHDTE